MGNFLSADTYLDQDACSGRNLTWQYIRHGSLPEPYSHCPHSAGILAAHNCKEGTCKPSFLDKEFKRYTWKSWDGLGQPNLAGVEKTSAAPEIVGTKYGTHKEPYKPNDDRTATRTRAKRGWQCAFSGGGDGNNEVEVWADTGLGQSERGLNKCHRPGWGNGQQRDQQSRTGLQEPKVQGTVVEVPTTESKVLTRLRRILETELSSSHQSHVKPRIRVQPRKTTLVQPYFAGFRFDWPSIYRSKLTRHPHAVQNLADAFSPLTTSTHLAVSRTSYVHVVTIPTHLPLVSAPKKINYNRDESYDSAPALHSTTVQNITYGEPEFKDELRKGGGPDYIEYLELQAKPRKDIYETYTLQLPGGRILRSNRHQRAGYSDTYWTKQDLHKPHVGTPEREPCRFDNTLEAPGLSNDVCGPRSPPQISAAELAVARNSLWFVAFWAIVLCYTLGYHCEDQSAPPAPGQTQVTIEVRESDRVWRIINDRRRRNYQDPEDNPGQDSGHDSGYHSDDGDHQSHPPAAPPASG